MKKIVALAAAAGLAGLASAQPASFIDLGIIGGEGLYTFDTVGGDLVDPEMGLWDNSGILLAANDDAIGLQSQIALSLTAGMYWIGVSEFNSVFENGWLNTGSAFEGGDDALVNLNIDGVSAGGGLAGDFLDQETLFFKVTVTPAPASMALLGLGGLVATRRRRA